MSLQDDGEVSKLEEECNWFRMETNRLQTQSSTMQTDIRVIEDNMPFAILYLMKYDMVVIEEPTGCT